MKRRLLSFWRYFSLFERILWIGSLAGILVFHFLFANEGVFSLLASLLGVTAVLLCAKGNPLGQGLCIVFGVMYAIISYSYAYYGEMLTYAGMTVPMAVLSLVAWFRNPYGEGHSVVHVGRLARRDAVAAPLLTVLVSVASFFVLRAFGTANLAISTFSVTTSFLAVYLTYRRSPFFALAYAANDIVLVVLWLLATLEDSSYLSVVICFAIFLLNDIYGFINWCHMEKRQNRPDRRE